MNTSLWLWPQACQHPWLQPAAVSSKINCDKLCVFAQIWRLGKFKFLYCTSCPSEGSCIIIVTSASDCDGVCFQNVLSPKPFFVLSQHVPFSWSTQARARHVQSSKVQDSRFWKLPRISDKNCRLYCASPIATSCEWMATTPVLVRPVATANQCTVA